MIVVVTAEAEAYLEQIAAYVAEQSPPSERNLVCELRHETASHCWMHRAVFRWFLATSTRVFAGACSVGF